MKRRIPLLEIGIYLLCLCSCSLPINDDTKPSDNPAEADHTYLLPWEGDTDKFDIDRQKGIQLNDTQKRGGTAYLSTHSATVRNTSWEFNVRLTFNPSANNYARFYLASSVAELNAPTQGYFVQIGGDKDNIALYRQNGTTTHLLISGRELMKGNNSPALSIKATCDGSGHWSLSTRLDTETTPIREAQVRDTTFQRSVCYGVLCTYTSSRSKDFTFQQIRIGHQVPDIGPGEDSTDPPPTAPTIPELPDEVRNMLLFNEIMYHNSSAGAEYVELYNPSSKTIKVSSLCLAKLYETGDIMSKTILRHPDEQQQLTIPAKGYICFTKSVNAIRQMHRVTPECLIEIANFPPLNDSGGILALITNETRWRLIDKCRFNDTLHSITPAKNTVGISIEKESPELSSVNKSWRSSHDPTGGTPGKRNSER